MLLMFLTLQLFSPHRHQLSAVISICERLSNYFNSCLLCGAQGGGSAQLFLFL